MVSVGNKGDLLPMNRYRERSKANESVEMGEQENSWKKVFTLLKLPSNNSAVAWCVPSSNLLF